MRVGAQDGGPLSVTGPIAPANTSLLSLFGAGGFSASGSGSLAEDELRLSDGSAAGRTWSIKPADVSDGGAAIPYTAGDLSLLGGSGADTFNVEPSTTTEYLINGGAPSGGGSGDKLVYDALGATPTGDLTPSDGFIDRSGRQTVTFQDIETVSVINDDDDGDGLVNSGDNCPSVPNAGQADFNSDGQGDACDNSDGDSKLDAADNCALVANEDQLDIDSDGAGDACDTDDDGDDDLDSADNCPSVANADQRNSDGAGDGGDACDVDDDGDGHADGDDNCPTTPNPGLVDHDRDGIGTACDTDLAPGACSNHQTGGAGGDTLTGTEAGDRITGLAGNDLITGLAGDDCLYGQDGDDRLGGDAGDDLLKGHDGDDRLGGGDGDDRLSGGKGNDRLTGGAGKNTYAAHSGNDRVSARNGVAETINCGAGRDRATVDADDTVAGCEVVSRP